MLLLLIWCSGSNTAAASVEVIVFSDRVRIAPYGVEVTLLDNFDKGLIRLIRNKFPKHKGYEIEIHPRSGSFDDEINARKNGITILAIGGSFDDGTVFYIQTSANSATSASGVAVNQPITAAGSSLSCFIPDGGDHGPYCEDRRFSNIHYGLNGSYEELHRCFGASKTTSDGKNVYRVRRCGIIGSISVNGPRN